MSQTFHFAKTEKYVVILIVILAIHCLLLSCMLQICGKCDFLLISTGAKAAV